MSEGLNTDDDTNEGLTLGIIEWVDDGDDKSNDDQGNDDE